MNKVDQSKLIVNDWSLKKLKKVGQNVEPTEPFYLPYEIKGLKYKNNCYYIFEQDSGKHSAFMRILDESGLLLELFQVENEFLIHIDSENRLIFGKEILGVECSLIYMNQKGNILRKIDFSNTEFLKQKNWTIDKSNTLHGHFILPERIYPRIKLSVKFFCLKLSELNSI